jgi:hypothetical protein
MYFIHLFISLFIRSLFNDADSNPGYTQSADWMPVRELERGQNEAVEV